MKPKAIAEQEDATPKLRSRVAPLIACAPLPMVEVEGADHRVCFSNPAFCALVGRTPEELLGKPFAQIVRNGDKCGPLLDRVYQTGRSETHVDRDDSAPEPSSWLYAMWPALDADKEPERVVIQLTHSLHSHHNLAAMNEALFAGALFQHQLRGAAEEANARLQVEISERKTAEAALLQAIEALKAAQETAERSSRAKDDFLATLSHELRTPLTPVLATAAALREDMRLPPEVRGELAMIERNVALEARLIDDLLDLTKISHGKLDFRVEPCDAHHLIAFALDMVREEARAKGVAIACTLAARKSGLAADSVRFQQVIWNLLRNAVKFTPPGGRVSVCTREHTRAHGETWLRIEVADTGIGIEPQRLQQIFRPFDQGRLAGDHRFGGLGLGLAIAQAIVDRHGGHISAQSEGPSHGSQLIVELPGAVDPAPRREGAPAWSEAVHWPPTPAAPLRLLLVEDHVNTLQTLQRLLMRDGHTVATATTVGDALAIAATTPLDLVISDLGLPDGTGIELMNELRIKFGLRGVALTGYGAEADVAESHQAGFVSHLTKPVAIAELRRVVATFQPVRRQPAGKEPTQS